MVVEVLANKSAALDNYSMSGKIQFCTKPNTNLYAISLNLFTTPHNIYSTLFYALA